MLVGRLLMQLEDALDQAYSLSGLFGAALVDARRARGLSRTVGQPILDRVARITAAVGAAQGETVNTHKLVDRLAKSIGIDTQAYGDGTDKPAPGFVEPSGAIRLP